MSDNSDLFTENQNDRLTRRLVEYDSITTNQIIVVTVDSIKPYTDIQIYASELGNSWGIGQKERNNGLTIVISDELRKIGIASGYGTEKILMDSVCSVIIKETIIPDFKDKSYFKGISIGLDSLISKWH